MNIKEKLSKCQLEKEEESPKYFEEGKYYTGYTKKQGKCRQADKVTYNTDDHYNAINTSRQISTEAGCYQLCEDDPMCTAFHYYILDPGALDNCNIWTATGYTGNDSRSSICYTKDDPPPEAARDATPSSTDCSNHGEECSQCDNNFEVAGCTRCQEGFLLLGGACYETVVEWGGSHA